MSIGFIKVQASTSRAELPVEGATVTITEGDPGSGMDLLSLQRTDESGQTDAISIDTPELSNSQTPDQAKGWTDVTVTVSHPDYDGITVTRVQVFPGVTTVQEMLLIPRGGFPLDPGASEHFDVPPQGL
ncbi:MAG: spore cortex-lytic protein [Oscillospiraceae bacterium]|nr:spore cortex-lytic protein [Oscillospiraceae bacterium]